MNIVDLSHPVGIGTLGVPGCSRITGWPMYEIALKDYNMLHVSTDLHTGTHLDAPLHCMPGGREIAQVPLEKCVGPAWVLHLPQRGQPGALFGREDFEPHAAAIEKHRKVLVSNGWSRHWSTPAFYENFPGFTLEAAQYLTNLGLELIGVEQASVHPTEHLAVHRVFFEREVVIVEGLANLSGLPAGEVEFFAAPWRFNGGDGSPVRAFARV